MNTELKWIEELTLNPHDWQLALIFADWLDDNGESLKAEQWRYAAQCMSYLPENSILWLFTQLSMMDRAYHTPNLRTKAGEVEEAWANKNGIRFITAFPYSLAQAQDNQNESIAHG